MWILWWIYRQFFCAIAGGVFFLAEGIWRGVFGGEYMTEGLWGGEGIKKILDIKKKFIFFKKFV